MKRFIILLMLSIASFSFAQEESGFGKDYIFASSNFVNIDKQYHFVGGGIFGSFGYVIGLDLYDGDRGKAIWTGVAVGTGVNLLKEVTDIGRTGFDSTDLMWGFAGSVVSSWLMDKFFYPVYERRKNKAKLAIDAMKQADLELMTDEEILLSNISN